MLTIILFLSFLVCIFLGVPVAFSLGISSIIYLLLAEIPLAIGAQMMFSGIDSFTLICVPGFILAGNLMNSGGITRRIIQFANSIFGSIRGGLGLVNVAASMLFAGISGTALADAASIGGILIPAMVEEGYEADFAVGVTAASSTIGPIIPPSLPMIIAGTLTSISVGKLFMAGILPGILLGVFQMAISYSISVKRNHPKGERQTIKQIFEAFKSAFWAILMTAIILFGILGGAFTPTEASIIAVLYAVVVGMFVYKELKFKEIPGIIVESMRMTASIMVLVGFANLFAWILSSEQIPQMIASAILSVSTNKIVVLLLINLLLLFVGSFMETIAAIVILFPVLLPVVVSVGMNPMQFGVMAVFNLVIGVVTPPVGVCLFVTSSIGGISLLEASKAVLPFLLASIAVLLLVTFVPQVTMFLPGLLGMN